MTQLPDEELERRLCDAFLADEPLAWGAVLAGVRQRQVRRRLALAAAACLAGLVVATQAMGVDLGAGSLFGRHAPRSVKRGFAPPFGARRAVLSSIRLAAESRRSARERLQLWAARARSGAVCVQLAVNGRSAGAVGCGPVRPGTIGVYLATLPPHGKEALLGGAAPRSVNRVRLRFQDGTAMDVATRRGFWVIGIPLTRRRPGHALTRIEAFDRAGRVVAAHRTPAAWRPFHPSGAWRTVAVVTGRPLQLAPARNGETCLQFRRSDGRGVRACGAGRAWIVHLGPVRAGRLVLVGLLPQRASGALLRFRTGRTARITISDRAVYWAFPSVISDPPLELDYLGTRGGTLSRLDLHGPRRGGLYAPAWHGARYVSVAFGHLNSLGYVAGPLEWPDGRVTR